MKSTDTHCRLRAVAATPGFLPLKVTLTVGVCLVLSGCPSASNPTTPQSTPPSGAPPTSGGSPGSTPSSPPPAGSESQGDSKDSASTTSTDGSTSTTSPSSSGSQAGENAAVGDFPQGEFPGNAAASGSGMEDTDSSQEGSVGDPGFGDPGFGDAPSGADALPNLSDDEPRFEEVLGGTEQPDGDSPGSDAAGGNPAGQGNGGLAGDSGPYGGSAGGGRGALTPAEQVAILDAQLEQGASEFDTMILEEQQAQRQAARESTRPPSVQEPAGQSGGTGIVDSPYDGGMADGGSHSSGGAMGGVSSGGMPKNTAKYPAPADIPSGDDDDVVARQLREAAMREPDPAVREKLWEEYRRYKGIGE